MRPGLWCPRVGPVTGGVRIAPQAMWGRRRAEYAGDNRDRGRRDSRDRVAFAAGGALGSSTPQRRGGVISPRSMLTGRGLLIGTAALVFSLFVGFFAEF